MTDRISRFFFFKVNTKLCVLDVVNSDVSLNSICEKMVPRAEISFHILAAAF